MAVLNTLREVEASSQPMICLQKRCAIFDISTAFCLSHAINFDDVSSVVTEELLS